MNFKTLEKIATEIVSYKFRIHKQRRSRGTTRLRRKIHYRHHKPAIKRHQRIYRQRTKTYRRIRRKLRHYKRFGKIF